MKAISVCSGADGFGYAAQQLGIEVVAHIEIERKFDEHYKTHWPKAQRFYDLTTINPKEVADADIIFGGEPCQPHSIAGNKKGTADDRYLWPDYFRLCEAKRPRWIINENVVGSLRNMVLDQKIVDLESIGYTTRAFNIPACAVGAYHERQRIWLVAHSDSQRLHKGSYLFNPTKRSFLRQIQEEALQQGDVFSQPSRGFTGRVYEMPNEHVFAMADDVSTELAGIETFGNAVVPWIPLVLLGFILQIESEL